MTQIDNPYLEAARAARFGAPDFHLVRALALAGDAEGIHRLVEAQQHTRDRLAVQYAHAIPNDEALDALAARAPLVEIGAGTGYWAWMLRQRDIPIVAVDICPPATPWHTNPYHRTVDAVGMCWTEVSAGGPQHAAYYPDHTLFLCWPPPGRMAEDVLAAYTGQCVAFIGTQDSFPTANAGFRTRLRTQFALADIIPLPQWDGVDDRLTIWTRRKQPPGFR